MGNRRNFSRVRHSGKPSEQAFPSGAASPRPDETAECFPCKTYTEEERERYCEEHGLGCWKKGISQ